MRYKVKDLSKKQSSSKINSREEKFKKNKFKDVVDSLSKALSTMQIINEVELQIYLKNYEILLPENGIDFRMTIASYEKSLIRMALDKTDGNQTQAAELLNLRLSTLNSKIKRFEIKT